ncbi:hypothetical protein L7F22_059464 [Adiantum nelumboides]|nr:hypothetical protein [Adiantum nelumboides]
MQSEACPLAGMHMLPSPELLHAHFSGNATNHTSNSLSLEKVMKERTQSCVSSIKDWSSHPFNLDVPRSVETRLQSIAKDDQNLAQEGSQRLSDLATDDTESWASASSQELVWNDSSPAASDSDEMPRLTPDTSPVLHTGIQQSNSRRHPRVADEESKGRDIPNQETREHHAYSQCGGGGNQSRWRSAVQPIMHDDEGCSRASHIKTTTFSDGPSNLHVDVSTKSQDGDVKLPPMQAGRAFQPSMSRVDNVTDCDIMHLRKTKCSTPLGDKLLSSFSHGHFRFVDQDGTPCYSFCVENSTEVFFARPCRPESGDYGDSSNNSFHYAFYSRREDTVKGGRNRWLRRKKLASKLVAKMKISAVDVCIDSNRPIKETHFVLYTEMFQQSTEKEAKEDELLMQSSRAILCGHKSMESSMIQKGKVWIELLAVAITVSTNVKHKDDRKSHHESSLEERTGGWEAACMDRGSQKGWGVKFLSKFSKNGIISKAPVQLQTVRHSQLSKSGEVINSLRKLQDGGDGVETLAADFPLPLDKLPNCRHIVDKKHKELETAVDVVVLLPAGSHALRSDENGDCAGPTPLLECWQSDGVCDCGGWDMGCGMTVLRAETLRLHKRSTIALTSCERINWISPGRPFVIFSQGYKRRKLLMLDIIEAGLLSLSFQAQFSPLQAFATAVTILHQQLTL